MGKYIYAILLCMHIIIHNNVYSSVDIEAIALEELSDIGLEDTTDLAFKVVKMVVSYDDFQIPSESARRDSEHSLTVGGVGCEEGGQHEMIWRFVLQFNGKV